MADLFEELSLRAPAMQQLARNAAFEEENDSGGFLTDVRRALTPEHFRPPLWSPNIPAAGTGNTPAIRPDVQAFMQEFSRLSGGERVSPDVASGLIRAGKSPADLFRESRTPGGAERIPLNAHPGRDKEEPKTPVDLRALQAPALNTIADEMAAVAAMRGAVGPVRNASVERVGDRLGPVIGRRQQLATELGAIKREMPEDWSGEAAFQAYIDKLPKAQKKAVQNLSDEDKQDLWLQVLQGSLATMSGSRLVPSLTQMAGGVIGRARQLQDADLIRQKEERKEGIDTARSLIDLQRGDVARRDTRKGLEFEAARLPVLAQVDATKDIGAYTQSQTGLDLANAAAQNAANRQNAQLAAQRDAALGAVKLKEFQVRKDQEAVERVLNSMGKTWTGRTGLAPATAEDIAQARLIWLGKTAKGGGDDKVAEAVAKGRIEGLLASEGQTNFTAEELARIARLGGTLPAQLR